MHPEKVHGSGKPEGQCGREPSQRPLRRNTALPNSEPALMQIASSYGSVSVDQPHAPSTSLESAATTVQRKERNAPEVKFP